MKSALLIIDVQKGVVEGCHDVQRIVNRIADLANRARKDGVPIIWVQDEQDFAVDSDDWQLAEPLARTDEEVQVRKRFRDAFSHTVLMETLEKKGIKTLIVVGAQSDFCVRTAASRAVVEGFNVTLVSDAHTTTDCDYEGEHLTSSQIIAHTNMYWAGLRYPDVIIELKKASEVQW